MAERLQRDLAVAAVGLALAFAALLLAAPAMAGQPTPGAHYYGLRAALQYPLVEDIVSPIAEVRVSRSGRRLAAAEVMVLCGRGRSLNNPVVRLNLRRNPDAVVHRDGSFGFHAVGVSDTEGRVRLWLSGRFASAQYARLFYGVRDFPRRRSRDCRATSQRYRNWSAAVLYRDGQPPFSGCRSQRAGTLLRTDTGRVFQQLIIKEFSSFVTHVYACLYAIPHHRIDLGRNYDDETVRLPRLAGTYVAWWWGVLHVMDLREPASVRLVDPTPGFGTAWPQSASDLVLKPNGAIAWTVCCGPDGNELWALDAAGLRLIEPGRRPLPTLPPGAPGLRLLDAGPRLELESLELTDSTLTWLNGGTRTAVLD
jgi:hypothetical protein